MTTIAIHLQRSGTFCHKGRTCAVCIVLLLWRLHPERRDFLPPPKTAPQESKHFGHKHCLDSPRSNKHRTIKSTIPLAPTL